MRRFAIVITAIFLMFSIVACSTGPDRPDTETESSAQGVGHTDAEENPPSESNSQNTEHTEPGTGGGAVIILNMNGTDIHAKLYDNAAADAFLNLLPYTVTVSRATDDLCGSVSEQLAHDPAEDQNTWAIGEIGWFDGWFTILCDN